MYMYWRALWICPDFVGELVGCGLSDTAFFRRPGVETQVLGEIHGAERGAQRVHFVPPEQAAGGYLETVLACLHVLNDGHSGCVGVSWRRQRIWQFYESLSTLLTLRWV